MLGFRDGFCVACEAQLHRDPFVRRLSVCLSGSHTFLVDTLNYVSQAHAFLGMLLLCLILVYYPNNRNIRFNLTEISGKQISEF